METNKKFLFYKCHVINLGATERAHNPITQRNFKNNGAGTKVLLFLFVLGAVAPPFTKSVGILIRRILLFSTASALQTPLERNYCTAGNGGSLCVCLPQWRSLWDFFALYYWYSDCRETFLCWMKWIQRASIHRAWRWFTAACHLISTTFYYLHRFLNTVSPTFSGSEPNVPAVEGQSSSLFQKEGSLVVTFCY